jgi:hypothetical protein
VRRSTQHAACACNQPRACRHPWLSKPVAADSTYLCRCSPPYLVVLTVEFRLRRPALTDIPDALYMEYALPKRQPWRGGHLPGKVASVALVPGPRAVTKKVVKLFLGTCVDAMRFAAHFGAI